jgi:MFS family permease
MAALDIAKTCSWISRPKPFTVGLLPLQIPGIVADRYARLYHGYAESASCDSFKSKVDGTAPVKPKECFAGADDAQETAAWANVAFSALSAIGNPLLGTYSDSQHGCGNGRRIVLFVCLSLATIPALVLTVLIRFPRMNPVWYYVANTLTGAVSFLSVVLATLADIVPEKFRTVAYGLLMSGYYGAFALGPTVPLVVHSHQATAMIAASANIAALVAVTVLFPGTSQRTLETDALPLEARLLGLGHSDESETAVLISLSHQDANESISLLDCSHVHASLTRWSCFLWNTVTTPFREVSILLRTRSLRLVAAGAFFAAMVFACDATLLIYYIEAHLNVGSEDISRMFLVLGVFGIVLQAGCLKPLIRSIGDKRLLVVSFISGTVHNLLYGAARSKLTIYVAMILSQVTKLNVPLLSSFASSDASASEQGQVQGALFAVNSIAYCFGPVIVEYVYQRTEHLPRFGLGFMFIFASGLYAIGAVCVAFIPTDPGIGSNHSHARHERSPRMTAMADGENIGDDRHDSLAPNEREGTQTLMELDLERPLLTPC